MFSKKIAQLFSDQPHEFDFDYTIIRSKRKSLCIQIKQSAVRVLAPNKFPMAEINQFLEQKQHWIENKLQQQQVLTEQRNLVRENEKLFCNGELKTLVVEKASHFAIIESDLELLIQVPNSLSEQQQNTYIKRKLDAWFKQKALFYFPNRLAQLSYQLELSPSDLIIKKYKARWGSCNSYGVISFNYLLMMAPNFVIDYVIVHELCHLKHMNHSTDFWALVAQHYPEFKQAKSWLKLNNHQLQVIHY